MDGDELLINNPLALVDQIFGPEQPWLYGKWVQSNDNCTPWYRYDGEQEGDADALAAEGELCAQEE